MLIVVLFTLASLANAAIYFDGPCPDVKPMVNLNLTAYAMGPWYEVAKYPNDMENNGDCPYSIYTIEDNSIKFKYRDIIRNNSISTIEGYMVIDPKTGAVNHNSFGFEASESTKVMSVYVMEMDYNTYGIMFECRFDKEKNQRHEYAWVTSRTKQIPKEAKTAIDNYLKSSTIIDAKKLIWNHFDDQSCKVNA